MPNTLTAVMGKILAQGLLALRQQAAIVRLVNSNWANEVAQKGDTINVNVLATATAGMQWVRITTTGAAAQWPADTVITTSGTVFQGVLRIPTLVGGPDTVIVRGRVRDTQNREAGPDSVLVRMF